MVRSGDMGRGWFSDKVWMQDGDLMRVFSCVKSRKEMISLQVNDAPLGAEMVSSEALIVVDTRKKNTATHAHLIANACACAHAHACTCAHDHAHMHVHACTDVCSHHIRSSSGE